MEKIRIGINKGGVGKTAFCFFLGVALLALSIFTLLTAREIDQKNQLEAERERIKAGNSQIREGNRKLKAEIESLGSKEGSEKLIRDKGLVKKGELVYIFNH